MKWPSVVRNRREGVAVLFAVSLLGLLATGALAIDLGMLFTARAEAQRVADAAALAGASAFKDHFSDLKRADTAGDNRAILYATENTVRGVKVVTSDFVVEMDTVAFTAETWVRSPSLGTWMARTFGITNAIVVAHAKAWFAPVGGVKCVKPFAIPDLWEETNTTPLASGGTQDHNGDRRWGNDEAWEFEPLLGDRYEQWSPHDAHSTTATGYHSQWRNVIGTAPPFDLGLVLTIKSQQPGTAIASGFFYPWRIGTSSGANDYKDDITGCNPAGASVGVPYDIENGNMVGPTRQAINEVMATDPGAAWDPDPNTPPIMGSSYSNWRDSPRVIIAGLFDPNQIAGIQGAGNLTITFNNFALFFLEGLDDTFVGPVAQRPVLARFIGYAQGSDDGAGPSGPTNRRLRLIE